VGLVAVLIDEMDREASTTARVLGVVPTDKLDWAPHPKSMQLGQLAWHLASLPRSVMNGLRTGERDIAQARPDPRPADGDLVASFNENIAELKKALMATDDATLLKEQFAFKNKGEVVTSFPKVALIRTVLLNHSYHHRGQLSVYLRLLDVPVPSIYGRSADENPFERA
jgi:uncharacterized damage-inducible protein DinB